MPARDMTDLDKTESAGGERPAATSRMLVGKRKGEYIRCRSMISVRLKAVARAASA